MPLLNYYSQTKMAKGERFGYKTAILHLAPYKLSGKNVCPNASKACAAACLNTSGRGQMNSVQDARINKTNAFWQDRLNFLKDLDVEIKQLSKRADAAGFKFAVRLNGTSDLPWHRYKLNGQNLMELNPGVQFYDYTKVFNYLDHGVKNYYVVYSHSGENHRECKAALRKGVNVAYVFKDKLPKKFKGRKVIDGDKHDLRFKEKQSGVIIGLRAKGLAKKQVSDFVG
jgi:hypothetical protein